MTDDWNILQTYENEAIAEMTRERLDSAGIPAILKPGDASAYMGASSPYGVAVPAERVAEAKELLGD